MKSLVQRTRGVICNSRFTAGRTRSWIDDVVPVHVVPSPVTLRAPIDRETEPGEELPIQRDDTGPWITHVGGLIEQRDHATLIDGFARLLKRWPTARLAIVGDGPVHDQVVQLIDRYGVSDHVLLTGYRHDIGALLHRSDIYVNQTIDEGFGIAVVEAMLSGVPVVVSESGAHPELVAGGSFGLLFPPGDSQTLAEQMDRLLRTPELSRSMAERAKRSAEIRFPPPLFACRYVTAATRLMSRKAAS